YRAGNSCVSTSNVSSASSYRRGRFDLEPAVSLSSLETNELSVVILYKRDAYGIADYKRSLTVPQEVRRIGRFMCTDIEHNSAPKLLHRSIIGRFQVTTWKSACVVSRSSDSIDSCDEVVFRRSCSP
ncbi:hypothetical protein Pmar_PMAR026871, partial [Perkinsus marinus ATCC 50983]